MRVKIKAGTAVRLKKSRRPLSTQRDCTADLDKLRYTKEEQEELLQHPGISKVDEAESADSTKPKASTKKSKAEDAGATDAAVKLAAEHEIDLADITGTGADGRIVLDDVRAAANSKKGS